MVLAVVWRNLSICPNAQNLTIWSICLGNKEILRVGRADTQVLPLVEAPAGMADLNEEMSMDEEREQEYRDEAMRLRQLPKSEQRKIVEMYRDVANEKRVPARERKAGLERVAALERLLRLMPRQRKEE